MECQAQLRGGTDAASIAAARSLYRGDCTATEKAAASSLAADIMRENVDTDVVVDDNFFVEFGTPCGKATVKYTGPGTVTFAGVFGFDNLTAYAETTLRRGTSSAGGCARCRSAWATRHCPLTWIRTRGRTSTTSSRVTSSRSTLDNAFSDKGDDVPCSPTAGNFGWTCFDGDADKSLNGCAGSSSADALADMVDDGYKGEIDLDTSSEDDNYDCQEDATAPADCDQSPGDKNSLKDNFEALMTAGTVFPILGIDTYTCDKKNCNGSNATVRPVAFIAVKVTGVDMTGSPKTLTLQVQELFDEGTSVLATAGDVERAAPVPCDVEDNFSSFSAC